MLPQFSSDRPVQSSPQIAKKDEVLTVSQRQQGINEPGYPPQQRQGKAQNPPAAHTRRLATTLNPTRKCNQQSMTQCDRHLNPTHGWHGTNC